MKVYVDEGICIGCGLCTGICPEVFEMNDDGKATAAGAVTEDNEGSIKEAMDSCPVTAILEEK